MSLHTVFTRILKRTVTYCLRSSPTHWTGIPYCTAHMLFPDKLMSNTLEVLHVPSSNTLNGHCHMAFFPFSNTTLRATTAHQCRQCSCAVPAENEIANEQQQCADTVLTLSPVQQCCGSQHKGPGGNNQKAVRFGWLSLPTEDTATESATLQQTSQQRRKKCNTTQRQAKLLPHR